MLILRCILIFGFMALVHCRINSPALSFPGLQSLLDIFSENTTQSVRNASDMSLDELGVSVGSCSYNFIDYVSYYYVSHSEPNDKYIQHLIHFTAAEGRAPLYVNCIQPDPLLVDTENSVRMPQSVQEIVELLQPLGNNTKRIEPGRCVVIYFYLQSCLFSLAMSIRMNALPATFEKLQFAAIDVQKFPQFTTEFGIVGVPTVMLFHQGKPVLKYIQKANSSYAEFITKHTRIKATPPVTTKKMDPLFFELKRERSWVLYLAWWFIIACGCYYFGISATGKDIMEMIKQNWQESSEAQMGRAE